MALSVTLENLTRALNDSGLLTNVQVQDLQPMADTGLAHDHVSIDGHPWLLRVPKQSQLGLKPDEALSYNQACFERCAPSGHTPECLGVLPISQELPMGALVVEHIDGRAPILDRGIDGIAGRDWRLIMEMFGAIHAMPVPENTAPILCPDDPFALTMDNILKHLQHLNSASIHHDTMQAIVEEWDSVQSWHRAYKKQNNEPVRSMITFDGHPGNVIIQGRKAIIVDLEKNRYSHPGFDLAHATLYTSTTWDVNTYAELTREDVAELYALWLETVPDALARRARSELLIARRYMWLWSITWCAKWLSTSKLEQSNKTADGSSEDWSQALSEEALIDHVRDRVNHYLDPQTVARVRADWADDSPIRAIDH